jgi:dihydrofolate reductase
MIALIAAVAQNNVIGSKNDLPWYLPEDLKRFKLLTTGHIVLMGRKTYESIVKRIGKPLPNRKNIVISSHADFNVFPDVEIYPSVEAALEKYKDQDIYVIGGGTIFNELFNKADTLFITHVHKDYDGDVYFPTINKDTWREIKREDFKDFSFVDYKRAA